MKKLLYSLLAVLLVQLSFAAFTPYQPAATTPAAAKPAAAPAAAMQPMSVEAFEQATGKKLNRVQKWKYKLLQKRIARSQAGIFPYREDLTEGFQALPFFATIFTAGLVGVIMLFTARDRNAMRWALNGISVLTILIGVASIVMLASGY